MDVTTTADGPRRRARLPRREDGGGVRGPRQRPRAGGLHPRGPARRRRRRGAAGRLRLPLAGLARRALGAATARGRAAVPRRGDAAARRPREPRPARSAGRDAGRRRRARLDVGGVPRVARRGARRRAAARRRPRGRPHGAAPHLPERGRARRARGPALLEDRHQRGGRAPAAGGVRGGAADRDARPRAVDGAAARRPRRARAAGRGRPHRAADGAGPRASSCSATSSRATPSADRRGAPAQPNDGPAAPATRAVTSMRPISQTVWPNGTASDSVSSGGVTSIVAAVGSHGPFTGSPWPGTAPQCRSAEADSPGASVRASGAGSPGAAPLHVRRQRPAVRASPGRAPGSPSCGRALGAVVGQHEDGVALAGPGRLRGEAGLQVADAAARRAGAGACSRGAVVVARPRRAVVVGGSGALVVGGAAAAVDGAVLPPSSPPQAARTRARQSGSQEECGSADHRSSASRRMTVALPAVIWRASAEVSGRTRAM